MNETTSSIANSNGPFNNHLWVVEILIGVIALIAVNYLVKGIVKHVRQRALSHPLGWKQRLDHIFFPPLQVLLWILGLIFVLEITSTRYGVSPFESYLNAVRSTGIVVCLIWLLLRWKKEIQQGLLAKERGAKKVDAAFVHVVGKLVTVLLLVIFAMVLLQIWGLDIVPLIAMGGIGAAAIGFAGKDVMTNFFGGLMLYITRPFTAGDLIRIPDKGLEGHVEEIGWYLTSVRDKDKRPVYLPNAIFSCMSVINCSRMTHRRIEEKIGIRYEDFDRVKSIVEEIRQGIAQHPSIDTHLPIIVVLNGFGSSSIDLYIDVYTLATRYDEYLSVKQEILMLIFEAISTQGAQMPFPTTTLTLSDPLKNVFTR
jgi:MscS family membrane protein